MPVKMRLQRKGRKKRPFYHIVIADARSPRDGRFIESIGSYNPMTAPATIELDRDKAYDWLVKGAQPTETVRAILRFKGILYKKHLMRGVKKGAMTLEEAEAKFQQWVDTKDARVAARVSKAAEEKAAFHARIAGTPAPPKPAPAEEVEPVVAEETAPVAEAIEETAPVAEEQAEAETQAEAPAAEATAEEPAAEEEKTEE